MKKLNAKQKELVKWLRQYGNAKVAARAHLFSENIYETYSERDIIELKTWESKDRQVHTFML